MQELSYDLVNKILNMGVKLSKIRDKNRLFDEIIDLCMDAAGCDGGTLYICNGDSLEFKIMKTVSLGIDRGRNGEYIDLPPVPMRKENICAYSAISQQILNIEDVHTSSLFDFSGPIKYDAMTGYTTKSMLALPLIDMDEKTIGVLQLINALDSEGNIVSFSDSIAPAILALASQAAIALTNINYQAQLNDMIWSFTEAMTEAVDANTPYNGSHSRNVARLAGLLVDKINEHYLAGDIDELFDTARKEQLMMGGYLHDIGKVGIPHEVMNKPTRLGGREELVLLRLDLLRTRIENAKLKNNLDEGTADKYIRDIEEAIEVVNTVNSAGLIVDELYDRIIKCVDKEIVLNGDMIVLFTEEEKKCLLIRKGTLTDEERQIMQSHVEMTERILNKVNFGTRYKESPRFAIEHHEALDGSGYPKGLSGEQLSIESRILSVVDVCDALMSVDRPYKKPMPLDRVFAILHEMALKEGKLDDILVTYLEECLMEDKR